MEKAFFDFEEDTKLWCISTSDFTYKMTFILMLDLKRYVRASGHKVEMFIKVSKWYKQLNPTAKQKVQLECNKSKN